MCWEGGSEGVLGGYVRKGCWEGGSEDVLGGYVRKGCSNLNIRIPLT